MAQLMVVKERLFDGCNEFIDQCCLACTRIATHIHPPTSLNGIHQCLPLLLPPYESCAAVGTMEGLSCLCPLGINVIDGGMDCGWINRDGVIVDHRIPLHMLHSNQYILLVCLINDRMLIQPPCRSLQMLGQRWTALTCATSVRVDTDWSALVPRFLSERITPKGLFPSTGIS